LENQGATKDKMPLKLSTTIGKIQNIHNSKNIEIINEFLEYMRNNGSSEHHQNNNLKVVMAYGNFIGNDNSFLDINKKEQILEFSFISTYQILSW
jgi:integrase/recombinase XerD